MFGDIAITLLKLAGALTIFLFAMKLMGEGLQKFTGSKLRHILTKITGKPISGILAGTGVTAIIQSSTATTVMTVGFAGAGLLTLGCAIAVVMDANLHDYDHADLDAAYAAEHDINIYRDELRAKHLEALKQGTYDYSIGNAYSGLYALYEKLGDYVINVSEAIVGTKRVDE